MFNSIMQTRGLAKYSKPKNGGPLKAGNHVEDQRGKLSVQ